MTRKTTNIVKKLTKREKTLLLLLLILIITLLLYQIYFPHINLLIKKKRQLIQIKQVINTPKADLGRKIIRNDGLPDFIVSIEEACEKNQVKLLSIVPLDETQQAMKILTAEIKIRGTLNNILCFLHDLYKGETALTIHNITLTTNQDVSSSKWLLSLMINIYYQD